jgi:hypothetical protein
MTREEERKQDRACLAEVHAWRRKAAKRELKETAGMTLEERVEWHNRKGFGLFLEHRMLRNLTPEGVKICAEYGMLKDYPFSPEEAEYCAQCGVTALPVNP